MLKQSTTCDRCTAAIDDEHRPDPTINGQLRRRTLCLGCLALAVADPDRFWREGDWRVKHGK